MSKIVAAGVVAAVLAMLAVTASVIGVLAARGGAGPTNSTALADIPPDYLAAYQGAATAECPGLSWTVLAGIGKTESDHGRSTLPGVHTGSNPAGAQGPMQFLPATFAQYARPPALGQPAPSPYRIGDASPAAARMLCDHGAATDSAGLRAAVWAYNHSDSYVAQVLDQARRYTDGPPTTPGDSEAATVTDPSGTGGAVTPRLATLYAHLETRGALTGGASCWDPHHHNPDSDHPRGRACDVFFDPRDPVEVSRGWQHAQWLAAHHTRLGVSYLIWQGRIWTVKDQEWETYHSSVYSCPDPTNLTGCHYDHIHISVN